MASDAGRFKPGFGLEAQDIKFLFIYLAGLFVLASSFT